jgi:hypothetical protein
MAKAGYFVLQSAGVVLHRYASRQGCRWQHPTTMKKVKETQMP